MQLALIHLRLSLLNLNHHLTKKSNIEGWPYLHYAKVQIEDNHPMRLHHLLLE